MSARFVSEGGKPQTSIRSGHFLIAGLRSLKVDVRSFFTRQSTTRHFLLSAQEVPVRSLTFGLIEQRLFPHSTMLSLFSSSKTGVPKLAPRSLTRTARFTHLITYHRAHIADSKLAGDPIHNRPIDSFLNTRVGRSQPNLPRSIRLPCRSPRPPISQLSVTRRVMNGTGLQKFLSTCCHASTASMTLRFRT